MKELDIIPFKLIKIYQEIQIKKISLFGSTLMALVIYGSPLPVALY